MVAVAGLESGVYQGLSLPRRRAAPSWQQGCEEILQPIIARLNLESRKQLRLRRSGRNSEVHATFILSTKVMRRSGLFRTGKLKPHRVPVAKICITQANHDFKWTQVNICNPDLRLRVAKQIHFSYDIEDNNHKKYRADRGMIPDFSDRIYDVLRDADAKGYFTPAP